MNRPGKGLVHTLLCVLICAAFILPTAVQAADTPFAAQPAAWAAGAIERLERGAVLYGGSVSQIKPGDPIQREAFCELLVKLIWREGLDTRLSKTAAMPANYFSDISSSVRSGRPGGRGQMYYAAAYGLTEGVMKNGVRVADCAGLLTREQAAKMMCALYDALDRYAGIAPPVAATAPAFADAAKISAWAAPSVQQAAALGIMQGDQNHRFQPQDTLSWEAACVMIDRAMQSAEAALQQQEKAALGAVTLDTQLGKQIYTPWRDVDDLYPLSHNGVTSILRIYDGVARVEAFDAAGRSTGVRDIPTELSTCGGFCESADAYYLVFGQANLEESDQREVYRVVRYDKNWNRLGAASITGGQSKTTNPFDFTQHTALVEQNGVLILHTARQRYLSSDGLRHQSNFTAKIRTADMSVIETSDLFPQNHVSHSFAQYVRFDGEQIVYADQGDAYPRGFALNVASASGACTDKNFFPFYGAIGDNNTYAVAGGLGVSSSHYLFGGTSMPQDGHAVIGNYNAFLAVIPKAGYPSADAEIRWLSSFQPKSGERALNFHLVQVNDNLFVALWQAKYSGDFDLGELFYAVFDGQGRQIGQTRSIERGLAPITDPTVSGNQILWVRPSEATRHLSDTKPNEGGQYKLYCVTVTPDGQLVPA